MFSSFAKQPYCNYYPEEVFSTFKFIHALLEKPLTNIVNRVPGRLLFQTHSPKVQQH